MHSSYSIWKTNVLRDTGFWVVISLSSKCNWTLAKLFRFTIFAPNLKTSAPTHSSSNFSRNSILLYALALSNSIAKSETRETKEQKTNFKKPKKNQKTS
jgi:DNA-binding MurR/RpiR family transcriptional regulator